RDVLPTETGLSNNLLTMIWGLLRNRLALWLMCQNIVQPLSIPKLFDLAATPQFGPQGSGDSIHGDHLNQQSRGYRSQQYAGRQSTGNVAALHRKVRQIRDDQTEAASSNWPPHITTMEFRGLAQAHLLKQ